MTNSIRNLRLSMLGTPVKVRRRFPDGTRRRISKDLTRRFKSVMQHLVKLARDGSTREALARVSASVTPAETPDPGRYPWTGKVTEPRIERCVLAEADRAAYEISRFLGCTGYAVIVPTMYVVRLEMIAARKIYDCRINGDARHGYRIVL